MIGTTSSGTLIVLLGTYVLYVLPSGPCRRESVVVVGNDPPDCAAHEITDIVIL